MRFGRWDEILAEPEPPEHLPLSRALPDDPHGGRWPAMPRCEKLAHLRRIAGDSP